MNVIYPWNWLWLPPLAGGIILLWLRRPQRSDVVVPSLLLWRFALADAPTDAPRRKLQRRLLLFLQLLAVFLLIMALSRPFLRAQAPAGQLYLLILDNSASMCATDVRPSRLAAAQAAATDMIAHTLRTDDAAIILTSCPRPQVLCLATTDRARLRDAIALARPTDVPGDLNDALTLAQALSHGKSAVHVRVLTDGSSSPVRHAPLSSFDLRQVLIGTPHPNNVALTALEAQTDGAGQEQVSVTVQAFGEKIPSGLTLSLLLNGHTVDAHLVTLIHGLDHEEFHIPVPTQGAIITARLERWQDDLAADNTASLVVAPSHQRHLLLITAGNFYLERGLSALPNVVLEECMPNRIPTSFSHAGAYDAVILDGSFSLPAWPHGRYLTFNRLGLPTPLAAAPSSKSEIIILDQNSAHPVMRFVDLNGTRVRSTHRLQTAGWGQALVDSDDGPMIAAGEQDGSRVVSVGFDVMASNWPLQISFPLFLANSIDWLTQGGLPGATQPQFFAGHAAEMIVPPGSRSVQILGPMGATRLIAAPLTGGSVAIDETEHVGIYHVRSAGGGDYPFTVNLQDPHLSALLPQMLAALNTPHSEFSRLSVHFVRHEWWTWAAFLGLLLLGGEWWLYHRRG